MDSKLLLSSAQVLELQSRLRVRKVESEGMKLKSSIESDGYIPVDYSKGHRKEIVILDLFVQLIQLYDDKSGILENAYETLMKNLGNLGCKLKGEEFGDMNRSNFLENLNTNLVKAEASSGLENALDNVYDAITELRNVDTKLSKTNSQLDSVVETLAEMKKMSIRH